MIDKQQQLIIDFQNKYDKYKNAFGKISPYDYVCKSCSQEFNEMLNYHYSSDKSQLKTLILNSINNLQQEARQKQIPSKIFDYVSQEQLSEISDTIDKSKNVGDAINYIYQACLYGSGCDAQGKYKGRRKNRRIH